jgi:ketosteroid isomerase-like protein
MRKLFVLVSGLMLVTVLAAASEQSDAMARVHQFVDGFNKNDAKMSTAACAQQTSIIDDFAPYTWSGAGGCLAWVNAYHAWAKQNGISDGAVTLGNTSYMEVVGDRAYVVVPTEFSYKMNGKPMKEAGAKLTVVLHKGASGWLITAWTWSHP